MSDAGMALLLGIFVGGFMRLVGVSAEIDNMITFKLPVFIDVLLPMIMWFAGYTLSDPPSSTTNRSLFWHSSALPSLLQS
jgi:hypothetical protein